MRTRILTSRERKALKRFIEEDGERVDMVRVLAQPVRQNPENLHKEIELIEKSNCVCQRRNVVHLGLRRGRSCRTEPSPEDQSIRLRILGGE